MHTCSHQPRGFEQPHLLVNLFCMLHAESDVKNENFSNCFVSPIYCGLLLLRDCKFPFAWSYIQWKLEFIPNAFRCDCLLCRLKFSQLLKQGLLLNHQLCYYMFLGKLQHRAKEESARNILRNYTLKYVLRISYNDTIFQACYHYRFMWCYLLVSLDILSEEKTQPTIPKQTSPPKTHQTNPQATKTLEHWNFNIIKTGKTTTNYSFGFLSYMAFLFCLLKSTNMAFLFSSEQPCLADT